ncbi:MAG: zinc-ribbon domain-containing protein [Litoreibacter sp.]|uniref:zinc-ribbon domain-containing protein n=1 Tax=Litoreibacter sp. TaxID=1969459 RepID=UPI003298CD34
MRLVCPNCDAEYEVDDGLVPAEGRDVQCSNCTTTWFQPGAGSEVDAPAPDLNAPSEPDEAPTPETPELHPDPPSQPDAENTEEEEGSDDETLASVAENLPPQMPRVAPEALEIIHEEVALETAARNAEAGGIETQTDLGLDDADSEIRASAARERMARRRGLEPQDSTIEESQDALNAAPKREDLREKSGLFPDIEEINSTLSPEAAEAEAEAAKLEAEGGDAAPVRHNSGFRLGFGLMLLIIVGLLLLYVYAPQIAQRVPSLSSPLEGYVSMIDSLRSWLDMTAEGLVEKIGTSLDDQPEG